MSPSIYIKSNRRFVSEQQSVYWVTILTKTMCFYSSIIIIIIIITYFYVSMFNQKSDSRTKCGQKFVDRAGRGLSPCRSWKIFYLRQNWTSFLRWLERRGSWSIVAAIAFPRRQKTNVNKVCFRTFFIKNLNINISWGDTSATHPQPQSVKKIFHHSLISISQEDISLHFICEI